MSEPLEIIVRSRTMDRHFPDIEELFVRIPLERLVTLEPGTMLWMRHGEEGASEVSFSRAVLQRAIDLRAQENPGVKLYVEGPMALAIITIELGKAAKHGAHECIDSLKLASLLAQHPEAREPPLREPPSQDLTHFCAG